MKTKIITWILCAAIMCSLVSVYVFAEGADEPLTMTEGDVISEFVPAGTDCSSSDPSIAWVDKDGNLNALRTGATTIYVEGRPACQVTVADYTDGSEVAGRLRILARFNDSMSFYDGHVYLMFTSYLDDIEIQIDDLYGSYELSDQYYEDIRADISNGSNHTGTDTEPYFTYTRELSTMKLNQGDVVTIGMYRGFDLTVPQAAIGCFTNSTLWTALNARGKAAVLNSVIQWVNGTITLEETLQQLADVCDVEGLDYSLLMDGVVEGGVCLNRELYNQKLAWDQYENVTYELDITKNQLDTLIQSVQGNLNQFSMLSNSCATVALRAWNNAIGTRDGKDTAYKLNSSGEGIYSVMDAPKTVRDSIVERLPGYCLNNSDGVAEPDAGYRDETGWVYVSAPEPIPSKGDPNQFILMIGKKEAIAWGERKANDVAPVIKNERTMLPARFVAENLDAAVEWDEALQKVTIHGNDVTIELYINSDTAYVNGEAVKLDSPAYIENNRTYTPIRFVAESLGAKVDWDQDTQQIIITKQSDF